MNTVIIRSSLVHRLTMKTNFTVDSEGVYRYTDCPEDNVWEPYIDLTSSGHGMVPDEARMIGELLLNEILFPNSRHFVSNPWEPKENWKVDDETLVLYLNCNDIFAYAADAESVTLRELPKLYDLWKSVPKGWGPMKWCALKRKQKPLPRAIEKMKRDGAWDDELEALPK